jgi:hypothetical protein
VRNVRLQRAFRRGVRFLEAEGVWVVQIGRFRGAIEVEDTALFVDLYDVESGLVWLSDGTREPLRTETLRAAADGAFSCEVRGFRARFTHAAQAELLAHVEEAGGRLCLRVSGRSVALPLELSGAQADGV